MTSKAGTPDSGSIAFAQRLMSLLDHGSFTSTYKYAVLLALLDLSLEHTDRTGSAPTELSSRDLAEKVIEIYWQQAALFPAPGESVPDAVLRQNTGSQAAIVTQIKKFREAHAYPTPYAARALSPKAFDRLVAGVEWKLAEMPLPRLQRVGAVQFDFIYTIGWDEKTITAPKFREPGFDRRIRLVEGAGDNLVRLAGLLRPLIQRQWSAWIARKNSELIQDAYVDEFLFGTSRIDLSPVRPGLRKLQNERCFYCDRGVRGGDVDHFIPWSRYPDNNIDNLVLACRPCNGAKSNSLVSGQHVKRWAERLAVPDLATIAEEATFDHHPGRILSVARAMYPPLPGDAMLWKEIKLSVPASGEMPVILDALSSVNGFD